MAVVGIDVGSVIQKHTDDLGVPFLGCPVKCRAVSICHVDVGSLANSRLRVRKIAELAKEIGPDRVQLNTAVRPPAEDFAMAVSKERLQALTHLFHPTAEVIAEFSANGSTDVHVNEDTIYSMLERRPCTAEQIGEIFGMHLNEVSKYLGKLLRTDQIRPERRNSAVYYAAVKRREKSNADL